MTHPIMFDDADPGLALVRRITLALPEAQEKVSHGRPAFFTTKVFARFGGSVRLGPGEFERHKASVMVLPDAADEPALRQDARFWTPAYLGPRGWLGVDLDAFEDGELAELIDASYRRTAPARLVRRLDG
jgi:hypothetical protein